MMARNATLVAVIVLAASAFAADKPAVQGRIQMESEARSENEGTVAYQISSEARHEIAPTALAENCAVEPAQNVSYTRDEKEFLVGTTPATASRGTTKPAVEFRLENEKQ